MTKINPSEIFKVIKGRTSGYDEDTHCTMVLKTIGDGGTISTFCSEAVIGDTTFWDWNRKYDIFNECYRVAYMYGKEKWRLDGELNKDNEEFNFEYWKLIGLERYGLGRNPKIRMGIEAAANPYEQYKQLVKLANEGEFTSAEIKQMMEAINVGIKAHDSYKLQEQINEMQLNIAKMGNNNGGNIIPIESASKVN